MKNKISENNLRFIFIIITLIFLAISLTSGYINLVSQRMTTDDCLWLDDKDSTSLIITQIIPGGVADKAGLKDQDRLQAINGKSFVGSAKAMEILNRYSNENITYTISRNGMITDVSIYVYKFFNLIFLVAWLLGLGFLAVALMVGYSKPSEYTSKLFFFLGCTASTGLIVLGTDYPLGMVQSPDTFTTIALYSINYICILSFILFQPLFTHFFLVFPIKYEFRNPKLIFIFLYAGAFIFPVASHIAVFIFHLKSILIYGYSPGLFIFALYMLIGVRAFRKSLKKIDDISLIKSLKVISRGFLISGIGAFYLLGFKFFFNKPIFLVNPWYLLPLITIWAIPLTFGFSIIKYRILDSEFVVKKGLIFGIVSVIIIGIYLLLVLVLDSYSSDIFEGGRKFFTIAFIIVVTFTFDFVNQKAKGFVDKLFYRERYNYRKSLLGFSQELSYINNVNELLEKICSSVSETMGVKDLNVWLKDNEYKKLLEKHRLCINYIDYGNSFDKAMEKIYRINREPIQLGSASFTDLKLSEDERKAIAGNKINLSIPIIIKNEVIGALNFGAKPSGKAYSDEDIDLLKTLALQSVISFENSRLKIEEMSRRKFEDELKIARKIQDSMLPIADYNIKGLDISGYSEPARSIGGDFYDLIKLDEHRLLVIVADVSGKGIPAALYMSKVQAMIQFASEIFKSPADILREANKQIYSQIERKSFITMVAAIFDTENNSVKIARAGHNPVLHYSRGKVDILQSKGLGLGLEVENLFDKYLEEKEYKTENGDLFLFYSDGLNESMNVNKEELGLENVIEILKSNSNLPAAGIQNEIIKNVNNFRGGAEQNDDITFAVVKISGVS